MLVILDERAGVLVWPLAVCAACPGLLIGGFGLGRLAVRCVVTGSGWSGRSGSGRAAPGVEQVRPFGLAVPALGQVQGEVAAAVPGDAGGDVDQVAADGRAARSGVSPGGEGAGGAGEVVRDGGAARRRWRRTGRRGR